VIYIHIIIRIMEIL